MNKKIITLTAILLSTEAYGYAGAVATSPPPVSMSSSNDGRIYLAGYSSPTLCSRAVGGSKFMYECEDWGNGQDSDNWSADKWAIVISSPDVQWSLATEGAESNFKSSSGHGQLASRSTAPLIQCDGSNGSCTKSVSYPTMYTRIRTSQADGKYSKSFYIARGMGTGTSTSISTVTQYSKSFTQYWVKNGLVWLTQPDISCSFDQASTEIALGAHGPGETIQKDTTIGIACDFPDVDVNLSISSANGGTTENGWMRQTDAQGRGTELAIDCQGNSVTSCNYAVGKTASFHILARNVPGAGLAGSYSHSYVATLTWP